MQARDFLHISSVRSFLGGCQRQGVSSVDILERIGVPPETLDNPEGVFPVRKMGELISTISLSLQDETLGFMQRPTGIGGVEMSIHAVVGSKTLGEALDRWLSYWGLIHTDEVFDLSVHGDEVHISISFQDSDTLDRSSFITWATFVALRLAGWLVDKPILLDRLYFQFAEPKEEEDYLRMFPSNHYFDQSANRLIFNKRFMALPVTRTPEEVSDFMRILPHLLTVSRPNQTLTEQIRHMLQGTDNIDVLPLKTIAHRLGKSQDTVRRHLKTEGNSYKEIKESVRRDIAILHLHRNTASINQVAYMSGFSEPSAFIRAFKNWTGLTPGDYRKACTRQERA